MATTELWQQISEKPLSPKPWRASQAGVSLHVSGRESKLEMALDGFTILAAAVLANWYMVHAGIPGNLGWLKQTGFIYGHYFGTLSALLLCFSILLISIGRRLNLYGRGRGGNILNEQWLSLQACVAAGIILVGTFYLVPAEHVPRPIILGTLGLAAFLLCLRRLIYRVMMRPLLIQQIGVRNALIVGSGAAAEALRDHLRSSRDLGYNVKGLVDFPPPECQLAEVSDDMVRMLEKLFQNARRQFVDEVFFAAPCDPEILREMLKHARANRVGLRLVPNCSEDMFWNHPIEYIGQFPTVPLNRTAVPRAAQMAKHALDMVVSSVVVLLLAPLLLFIAIAVKLDSHGPVFYCSERVGKKGRRFRCIKFRTMVSDAEERRTDLLHMNERDGVLFKISNDPRVTRLGRFLRKYSLDELPQFFNVLFGDMSVVGPRPPLASEVEEYETDHLRRLDVMPGITGLWQVQARQDSSFESYISLDMTYIENWSIWLDLKIISRTIAVVFAGTGS
jgi:exopolysaccharide biosynthesis polyprenyl glycosylphosphotransferase